MTIQLMMSEFKIGVRLIRACFIAIGILGIINTALVSRVSSLNLGVVLPAIMGTPLLICGLFWPKLSALTQSGGWRLMRVAFFGGYALLLLAFAVTWLIIDIKAATKDEQADALIVLGAGLRGEMPTRVLRNRLDRAIIYMEKYPEAIAVLSGGKGEGEHISEAEAMARYLSARGIDESRFVKEDRSSNTRENFAFSRQIISERFGEGARIAFVTTDFHIYRAGLTAKKQGMSVIGVAAPDSWYIYMNNRLRECVALWAYAIMGEI